SNLTAAGFFTLIKQFAGTIGQISHTSALNIPIPFTSKSLGDALDFTSVMADKLTNFLADPNDPNQPGFSDAQSLADLIASKLGVDPSVIQANYDGDANELTYHVSLSKSFEKSDVGINLGIDLSPIGSLSSSSTFKLDATAGADFTFGFNLSPLAS